MEGPQLLFVKVANVKNSKVLNGTDGALVCNVMVDGVEYNPIDVVLRRPKSDHGLQKNSLVFQLPSVSSKFDINFMKQKKDGSKEKDQNILAKTNVTLQYSSIPMSLPRRSSYNSLSVVPLQLQQSNQQSSNQQQPPSPRQTSRSSSPSLSSSSGNIPSSPINMSSTAPILISQSPPNNQSSNVSYSPNIMSGSPGIMSGSPNIMSGSPGIMSGSPLFGGPPPYSLSAPSSPATNDFTPTFISYNNGQRTPVPIYASSSTSSPTLATINNSEQCYMDAGRIESSLKWYKLIVPGNLNSSVNNSNNNNNGERQQQQQQQQHGNHIVPSTSMSSFTNLDDDSTFSSSDDPEIQLQISYEVTNLPYLIRLKAMHREMLDLVVTPKLALVHSMCDAVDITAAQVMAKSLVDVFHSHHKLLHLLKSFLKKEVAACHDPGTLFRSNSVAMKMVVAYGHKTAQHYLQQTLTPLVVELCNSPLPIEVDPIKLTPSEDAETNQRNLRIVSQKFFDRIVASIDQCPKSIIEICYYFKKIVSRKFPAHWKSAVGGFIFLRLFCPACVSPENAGIISAGRVGISERRALVLVAKCLQNLSNQATFNQPYMENVNDFITENCVVLDEFFNKLAARPAEDHTIDGMMVSEDSLHDGIIYIQKYIDGSGERVQKGLASSSAPVPWDRVLEAVEASKRAVLSAPSVSMLLKQRANSTGSPQRAPNSPDKETKNKTRSNSDNKGEKWSTLTKNLRGIAKQNVITPTLNVISGTKSEEEVKIINVDVEWIEPPRSAQFVVANLLKSLIMLCKSNRLTDAASIKFNGQPLNWALIQQTPEFHQFSRDVSELQNIIFESTSPEYIAAFFINAFNLMILHLHFLVGPPNSDMRRKSYQLYRYNIGGCLYSLADIQHGILRGNPKNTLTRVRQIRSGDKRRQYVIPLDPRYHFVLFAVNVTLPCLRVMASEMLVEDLHLAGEEFCMSKIDICLKKKEISLPKLFSQFGTDFGKSRSEMLKWVFQFLTHAKRTELIDLLEKPSYICLYRSESWNPLTYKTRFIIDGKSVSDSTSIDRDLYNHQNNQNNNNIQIDSNNNNNVNLDSSINNNNNSMSPDTNDMSIPQVISISAEDTVMVEQQQQPRQPLSPRLSIPPYQSSTSPSTSPRPKQTTFVEENSSNNNNNNNVGNGLTHSPSMNGSGGIVKSSSNSAFDKEKVMRRKSRSLTHGNRMAPVKKDSTALTLINSLRMSAQASTKSILASLNDVVKRVAESIDIKYVTGILEILKRATRQLSFHEWQKSSTALVGGSTTPDKPSLSIKPQAQLFSNHQMHCLTPTALAQYAPIFQELYALTLSIEKETNKFLDFMDIASFSQSNDISELLADVAEQIGQRLREHESHDPLASVKETLELTIVYFTVTVSTKLSNPSSVDIQLANVLRELILDGKPSSTTPNSNQKSNSNINQNNNSNNIMINKLEEMTTSIKNAVNMAELSPIVSKIERIGRMIMIIEEQQVARYSPRQLTPR